MKTVKKAIQEYATTGCYAEYLKDTIAYKEKYKNNPDHLHYIENEFPKRLNWTDEEHYQHAIRWYEPEDIGEYGEVYSTYNPKSKWDWWTIGGRWGGMLLVKSNESNPYPSSWNCDGKEAVQGYAWVDSAKLKDIQWDKMREIERLRRILYWEEAKYKNDVDRYYSYAITKDITKEEYINKKSKFSTFAVVTPDELARMMKEWSDKP